MTIPDQVDVAIVGAGISGLTCAHYLMQRDIDCIVFEASTEPGGRVASDDVEGFTLDRGFQVFLTAYPEAQDLLDYDALELQAFEPGALVRYAGVFHRLSDPWRRPQRFWSTATSPVGTLRDKLRIAQFRRRTIRCSLEAIYERPETTTLDMLEQQGISNRMIGQFLRPFLGGVFLDSELATSSRMCEFVFRMFSLGSAALPRRGMRAIPQQLADKLSEGQLQTSCPVAEIHPGEVVLESGHRVSARAIVLATNRTAAENLVDGEQLARENGVACVYFAASAPPVEEAILVLNGDSEGPVNNLCVPSQVASDYAPAGHVLVSVTALDWSDADQLVDEIRAQLTGWFGSAVDEWRHLRTYEIRDALPNQFPPALSPVEKPPVVADGIYRCGDYLDTASINGAMASGRRAAEALILD